MFERLLGRSRFLVVLASMSLLLGAIALLVYGAASTVLGIFQIIWAGEISFKAEKQIVIELISLVDLFLLGIVLLIMSVGLHQLFIGPLSLPPALHVSSMTELKEKLVSVVVVVLGVFFLGEVGEITLQEPGQTNLVQLAVAASIIMIALTAFLFQQSWSEHIGRNHHSGHHAPDDTSPESIPKDEPDPALIGTSRR